MTTAEKIKMLRKQTGMTQTEFGKLLGVQKNAVSKWECGRVEDIPAGKIKMMATIFGVKPSYLIDDDTDDLTPVEHDLISDFRKLDHNGQEYILQTMVLTLQAYSKKNSAVPDVETAQ